MMAKAVMKFKSEDGKDFDRVEEAEDRDFFLKVREELLNCARTPWPSDYDGPMPFSEPTLETLCHYRDKVRHLFLAIEPPAPEIIERVKMEVRYRFPPWAAWWALILFGFAVGVVVARQI